MNCFILIFNNQIKIGPGLFFILPCIDNIITVDLRTITFDVAPQVIFFVFDFIHKTIIIFFNSLKEILTKDSGINQLNNNLILNKQ